MAGAIYPIHLRDSLLDSLFNGAAFPSYGSLFVALYTSGADLVNNLHTNEQAGGGYARQSLSTGAPSGGVISNTNQITFGAATDTWVLSTYMAVVSSSTAGAGDVIAFAPVKPGIFLGPGESFRLLVGALGITV